MQNGERCRFVAQDGVSCDKHGGEESLDVTRRRHAQTLIGQAEWAMAEQKRLAADPATDPSVKAKILDSMIDRAGLSSAQTVRLIAAEQADPIEKLFRAIAADPAGLEPPRERPETAISGPSERFALEAPGDAAQEAYDRLAESHLPDAEVIQIKPEQGAFDTPDLGATGSEKSVSVSESAKMPRHIRQGLERLERERRSAWH